MSDLLETINKRDKFIAACKHLFHTYIPLGDRSGINIITIVMQATLQCRKLGFLSILRHCFRLSHLLLFNLNDFLRFNKVIMLPNVKYLVSHHPKIVLHSFAKSYSYLALSLNTRSRLAILINHYCFINNFMNDDFLRSISDGNIVIWNETIETNHYSITLSYPPYHAEGNLDIILNMNSIPIYYLSFTIAPGQIFNMPDDHVLYITLVQGGENRFDLIKCATKALHEISPPAMLLIATRAIAIALNIANIAGITVKDQAKLGKLPATDHYFSKYDKFWISLGGEKINDRVFFLRTTPDEKPLSMINQSHRRRTRIKRQIQIDIMGQICRTFEQLCLKSNWGGQGGHSIVNLSSKNNALSKSCMLIEKMDNDR